MATFGDRLRQMITTGICHHQEDAKSRYTQKLQDLIKSKEGKLIQAAGRRLTETHIYGEENYSKCSELRKAVESVESVDGIHFDYYYTPQYGCDIYARWTNESNKVQSDTLHSDYRD